MIEVLLVAAIAIALIAATRRPPPAPRRIAGYPPQSRSLPAPPPTPIPRPRSHRWIFLPTLQAFACRDCGYKITEAGVLAARPLQLRGDGVYVGFARPELLPSSFWKCPCL